MSAPLQPPPFRWSDPIEHRRKLAEWCAQAQGLLLPPGGSAGAYLAYGPNGPTWVQTFRGVAYSLADQSALPADTWNTVVFDTELEDTGGVYDPVTGELTIPAGVDTLVVSAFVGYTLTGLSQNESFDNGIRLWTDRTIGAVHPNPTAYGGGTWRTGGLGFFADQLNTRLSVDAGDRFRVEVRASTTANVLGVLSTNPSLVTSINYRLEGTA